MRSLSRWFVPILLAGGPLMAQQVPAARQAAPPPASAHTAFAGAAWGDTRDSVNGKLRTAGFTGIFTGADEDVPVYRGNVFGVVALALPSFDAGGKLNLLTTLLKAGPDSSFAVYQQLVQLLSDKYGTPSNAVQQYTPPYVAGGANTPAGVASGQVRLSTSWALPDELIVVSIGRSLDVVVSYQPVGAQGRDLF
jgi:hypothetical protein